MEASTALEVKRPSVCYANPAFLMRRPISELLALQEGERQLGLLIPAKRGKLDKRLYHTGLFKNVELLGYRALSIPVPFEWPIPMFSFFSAARKALREYDVVHAWAHFYPSTLILMFLSLFYPKTKIILTMDTLPGYSFKPGSVLTFLFKLFTWTAGRIIYWAPDTITLYGKALLPHARRSGINMQKVTVIPTGMLVHKLPARAKKGAHPSVLYVGLLNPRKRVQDILEVARRLPDARFLIAGDGLSRKQLERKAPGNVRFLGWRKDVLKLLSRADVFLFPSSAEGLPGVVMEAMLAGTPVVTTRIPCTTDLIRDKKEGFLCSVGDTTAMARAVQQALNNKRVAAAAKRRITTLYNWKKILPMYTQLYAR